MESIIHKIVKKGQEERPERETAFTDKLYRKLSRYISFALIRCRFSPHKVTLVSILFAIAGGISLGFDNKKCYFAGAILLLIFLILDYCDGEVARYLDAQTMSGHYFDYFSQYLMQTSFFTGLTCGIYLHNSNILVLIIGMLGLGGILMRGITLILIKEVICIEYLRVNKKPAMYNQSFDYVMPQNSTSNDIPIETKLMSYFKKIPRLLLRISGGDDIVTFFVLIAGLNYFTPTFTVGKWIIGLIDVYFLYTCLVNVLAALYFFARNVLKRKVEQTYNEFFCDKF
jgi:phosphatidylglycerophosphate synthase